MLFQRTCCSKKIFGASALGKAKKNLLNHRQLVNAYAPFNPLRGLNEARSLVSSWVLYVLKHEVF